MAFALNKSQDAEKAPKKSPLAGWLGKKSDSAPKDELPQMDVVGGLTRALRVSNLTTEQPIEVEQNDPARDALGAIESALYAIDGIRDILEQACEVALSAKSVEEVGGRALLAESFDELRLSINKVVDEVDPRAATLIGKSQRHIDVLLGGKTRYSVSPMRMDVTDKGLNLAPPRDAFATYEEIDATLEQLDRALGRADRAAASYCRDAQYLIARMNGGLEG